MTDFFGGVSSVEITPKSANLPLTSRIASSSLQWENIRSAVGSDIELVRNDFGVFQDIRRRSDEGWSMPLYHRTSWDQTIPGIFFLVLLAVLMIRSKSLYL